MRASAWEGLGQRIYLGHALDVLREMPDESYQAVCCSPPYYSLRNYGTEPVVWDEPGGGCAHEWSERGIRATGNAPSAKSTLTTNNGRGPLPGDKYQHEQPATAPTGQVCARCGAMRCELGAEPTVSDYVRHLVAIFREVKRVLRPDGIAWCNIGDSYVGNGHWPDAPSNAPEVRRAKQGTSFGGGAFVSGSKGRQATPASTGVPAKSLLLVPERLAIALSEDGWTIRSRICWAKTSAMPESVRDRPTSAWEHVWMLTRSERYFYDAEAVAETASQPAGAASLTGQLKRGILQDLSSSTLGTNNGPATRNLRNFWLLGPEPLDESHFAAYPSELARRCLLASTSAMGCCPRCRAPWRRCVERTRYQYEGRLTPKQVQREALGIHGKGTGLHEVGWAKQPRPTSETTGWQPTCSCDAGPPVPMRILDPFVGSGTSLLVARELGLEGHGIELNQAYVDIAARRVDTWQKVEDAADARGQARLFEVPA